MEGMMKMFGMPRKGQLATAILIAVILLGVLTPAAAAPAADGGEVGWGDSLLNDLSNITCPNDFSPAPGDVVGYSGQNPVPADQRSVVCNGQTHRATVWTDRPTFRYQDPVGCEYVLDFRGSVPRCDFAGTGRGTRAYWQDVGSYEVDPSQVYTP
jgi:hypothetical protein